MFHCTTENGVKETNFVFAFLSLSLFDSRFLLHDLLALSLRLISMQPTKVLMSCGPTKTMKADHGICDQERKLLVRKRTDSLKVKLE
jgi:hypothetical protein